MKKKLQSVLKNQKGLTLVELLAVIVILGIIAAIAVPSIGGIIDKSKEDAHKSNALLIINSAKLAVAANDDIVKITGNGSKEVTVQSLVTAGYLDTVPADPDVDGSSYNAASSVTITKASGKYSYVITLSEDKTDGKKYYNSVSEESLNSGTATLSRD